MLTRIRLENFKSWEELDLELANITVLFGTNSSGKTSVLDALLLLKQTVSSFDRSLPINLGGGEQDYIDFGSYRDLVYQHDSAKHLEINLEWKPISLDELWGTWGVFLRWAESSRGSKESEASNEDSSEVKRKPVKSVNYSVRWRQARKHVRIERFQYEASTSTGEKRSLEVKWSSGKKYTITKPNDPKEAAVFRQVLKTIAKHEDLVLPVRSSRSREVNVESCYTVSGAYSFLRHDVQDFSREFEILMDKIAYLGPLREHPRRLYIWRGTAPREIGLKGERTIELLASRRERSASESNVNPLLIDQVSDWLKKMKLVDDFRIETISAARRFYETRVKTVSARAESSLADVGFGLSQVLPVITLLFFVPEGSIVLMEQPEIHLHPCAQARLADLFLHVAESRKLQLIVESHSEYFLRRLQRRVAEPEPEFANPEHIRMYFCEVVDGHSIARPVEIDKYGQIKNWPENFFGEVSEDLHAMTDAALARRRQELSQDG